jgi:hypothetical protein
MHHMNADPHASDADHPFEEIRAAVTVIHDVAFEQRAHDDEAVAAAHSTLAQLRHHLQGPLRDAIDHYLADDTWHHGPHHLRHAIQQVARHAGLPDPDSQHIAEQPTLF